MTQIYIHNHGIRAKILLRAATQSRRKRYDQNSLLHVSDAFKKVIVAGDRYSSGYNENGILVVSLFDLLLGKIDLWK